MIHSLIVVLNLCNYITEKKCLLNPQFGGISLFAHCTQQPTVERHQFVAQWEHRYDLHQKYVHSHQRHYSSQRHRQLNPNCDVVAMRCEFVNTNEFNGENIRSITAQKWICRIKEKNSSAEYINTNIFLIIIATCCWLALRSISKYSLFLGTRRWSNRRRPNWCSEWNNRCVDRACSSFTTPWFRMCSIN